MLELSNTMDHNIHNLMKHVKAIFGPSWEEVLCEGSLVKGNAEPGCPAILIISSSAVRCVEILRFCIQICTLFFCIEIIITYQFTVN
jgi:protein CMS1